MVSSYLDEANEAIDSPSPGCQILAGFSPTSIEPHDEQEPEVDLPKLRARVTIIAAGIIGCLVLAAFLRSRGFVLPVTEFTSVLRWMVIFSAPVAFGFSRFNARLLVKNGCDQIAGNSSAETGRDAELTELFVVYRSQILASATILACAALLCVAAVFLVGSQASFAMSIVFAAAIQSLYPSDRAMAAWFEEQLQLIHLQRSKHGYGHTAQRG